MVRLTTPLEQAIHVLNQRGWNVYEVRFSGDLADLQATVLAGPTTHLSDNCLYTIKPRVTPPTNFRCVSEAYACIIQRIQSDPLSYELLQRVSKFIPRDSTVEFLSYGSRVDIYDFIELCRALPSVC